MKVLILTTDAGGGHRSVARALTAGFEEVGAGACDVEVVDYLARYAPFPLCHARELYSFLMRYPLLYDMIYEATNTRRSRAVNAPAVALAMEAGIRRLLRDHSPDVIVATHPLGAAALTNLLYRRREALPYHTVVTDYGALHAWWAFPFGETWFAPGQETADELVRAGVPARRVVVSGYPVHSRFARPTRPAAEIRLSLGLAPDRFTVLLAGGAEGVGPLEETSRELAATPAPWQLIVVTGRNRSLKERLEAQVGRWPVPVRVDGLVDDMPGRMHAADLLLGKAGGSTLSEALTCNLPMLLINVLPGQEEENARHFVRLGVARPVADPAQARAAIADLAAPGNPALRQMVTCAQSAAHPHASLQIARHVLAQGTKATAAPVPLLFGLHLLEARIRRRKDKMK
jgi:1,2-diacylglycerol 3-beta-galactosyltransferase